MIVIKLCSKTLHMMATNSGSEIDDIYRNVNGITFQMGSMESAYEASIWIRNDST